MLRLRYLRTGRVEVDLFVFFAMATLLAKVLVFNSMPEAFPFAAKLGEIVDKLCASIVSAYMFFLIVTHLKSEKDKEAVNPYVSKKVQGIVDLCRAQLSHFQRVSAVNLDLETLTRQDIEAAFKMIHPLSQAPGFVGFGRSATCLQFMGSSCTATTRVIEKLFRKITFLDSRLVQLLADIEDCGYFSYMESLEMFIITDLTLEAWATSFFDYCVLARELDEHKTDKLAKYQT